MSFVSWGSGPWGSTPWGGGSLGVIAFVRAVALRENVVRLEFTEPVYLSTLLDIPDASRTTKYTVTPIAGTIGADGTAARAVSVALAALGVEAVDPENAGHFIDLTLDRPMTPYPARYTVAFTDIFAADLASVDTGSASFDATFRVLAPPTIETPTPSRDIANPQTQQAMLDPLPDPNNPLNLGTFVVNDEGDYAFDEGLTGLKKRILRRLVTSPGAFAHLPTYGVGAVNRGKKLGTAAVLAELSATAEAQIAREPEVARVRVRALVDQTSPGLVRFQVLVRTKVGIAQRFDVPLVAV